MLQSLANRWRLQHATFQPCNIRTVCPSDRGTPPALSGGGPEGGRGENRARESGSPPPRSRDLYFFCIYGVSRFPVFIPFHPAVLGCF